LSERERGREKESERIKETLNWKKRLVKQTFENEKNLQKRSLKIKRPYKSVP